MHADGDADRRTPNSGGFRVRRLQHEAYVPLVKAALDDEVPDRRGGWQFPMQDDLRLPDVLDVQAVAGQFTTVAVAVLNALEALGVLEPGRAAAPFVERLGRLIQTAEHLLDWRGVEHPP